MTAVVMGVSCGGDEPAAPSDTNDNVTSAVIGPSGGTLRTPNGDLELVVPAGALDRDVTITAEPTTVPASFEMIPGTAWKLGPDGTTFALPTELTTAYDPADVPANAGPLYVGVVRASDNEVEFARSTQDTQNNRVTGEIYHFTVYSTGPCPSCLTIDNPRADWDPVRRAIVLEWDAPAEGTIAIKREGTNDFGTPPIPELRYAQTPASAREFPDFALGTQAKIYWYWMHVANVVRGVSYIGPPTEPMFVSYFGTNEPPDSILGFAARAVPGTPTSIRLTWQPTPTADRYELSRAFAVNVWETVRDDIPFTDYYYTDTGLPLDTLVYYRLRGVSDQGQGPWVYAQARTVEECAIVVEVDGAPAPSPVLPGYITLRAVNCGVPAVRTFEWFVGEDPFGGQEPEITFQIYADLEVRLNVYENATLVASASVFIDVLELSIYSEVTTSKIKPRTWESFRLEVIAYGNGNSGPIMTLFPEVESIDWKIQRLVNFVPADIVLTATETTQSHHDVAGNTLAAGWYYMSAIARAGDGSALSVPYGISMEILPAAGSLPGGRP
jgi:hypothetical protein